MNIIVQDVDLLSVVVPDHVKAYLRANGWSMAGRFPDGDAELWKGTDRGGREVRVTVLTDRELGDYAERTFELLNSVAAAEQRAQMSLFEDIQRVPWDAVAVRSEHPASLDGSIPWREGVRLHESVQGMLVAGALSTIESRPIHPSARPLAVKEYTNQLRMGQTSRGSYIVNALSPLRIPSDPPMKAPLFPLDAGNTGFGRKTLDTLVGALAATQSAARIGARTLSADAFVEAVSQGVSANLLESIAETMSDGEGKVHVAIRWSPLAQARKEALHSVTFEPDEVRVIDAAGRHFRSTYPEHDVELEGFVVRVDRTTERLGDIIALEAWVRGKVRRVALDLFGDAYKAAIAALEARTRVRFRGTLVKAGRGFALLGPTLIGQEWPESSDDPALELTEEDRLASTTATEEPVVLEGIGPVPKLGEPEGRDIKAPPDHDRNGGSGPVDEPPDPDGHGSGDGSKGSP